MEFRLRVKKLAALSFVPVADLVPVYESLATTFLADELALLHHKLLRQHGLDYLSEDEEWTPYSQITCGISRNAVLLDQPGQRTV